MTDINNGLLYAVDMLTSEKSDSFPDMSMIILLTDGRPSSGVYWPCRIQNCFKILFSLVIIINKLMLSLLGIQYALEYEFSNCVQESVMDS